MSFRIIVSQWNFGEIDPVVICVPEILIFPVLSLLQGFKANAESNLYHSLLEIKVIFTDIFLKVALNTLIQTLILWC